MQTRSDESIIKDNVILFPTKDVHQTKPRQKLTPEMREFLQALGFEIALFLSEDSTS